MILCIDIGNTQTSCCFFNNDSLEPVMDFYVPTFECLANNYLSQKLKTIWSNSDLINKVDKCIIASVVANAENHWISAIKEIEKSLDSKISIQILNAKTAENLSKDIYDCIYPRPLEVGADIIAASIAAKKIYGSPSCVIDFGTATNINIVNEKGQFVSAVISPGLQTSLNALTNNADLLKKIKLKTPPSIINTTTEQTIQAGIIYGEAARADGLIERIEEKLGAKTNIIATGGWCQLIGPEMKRKPIINPYLVLQGLKICVLQNMLSVV